MSTTSGRLLLLVAVLTFAGCATTPSTPTTDSAPTATPTASAAPAAAATSVARPATAPVTPPPVVELPPATLTGSEQTSAMLDNFTAYVTAIDGVPVAGDRQGWKTPAPLKAGPHRVSVSFIRGVFTAQAVVEFVAVSEAAYQVRFATDAELFGKNSYCEFWIVDTATDQPASPRVRCGLNRIEPAK